VLGFLNFDIERAGFRAILFLDETTFNGTLRSL